MARLLLALVVVAAAVVAGGVAAADAKYDRAHRHLAGCHERGRACEVHDHACHHEASECYMSAGEAAQEHLPLAAQYASVHALACRAAHWIAAGKPSVKPEGMASCMMPDPRNLLQLDREARRRLDHLASHVVVRDCDNFDDAHAAMQWQGSNVRALPNKIGAAASGSGHAEGLNHANGRHFDDDYFRLEVEDGNVVHTDDVSIPVYNEDGTRAVIVFEFDNPTDDYYCVFDFGDPSGTYGLTMSWNIDIDYPRLTDQDDDPPNFVSLFVVNYETGDWRRVFLTGDADTASMEYSAEVYAAPGEFVRWVSYIDDDEQMWAQAELMFGDGEPDPLECTADHLLPDVKYLPAQSHWITTENLGGSADYNFMGVDYWIMPNDDNQRGFASCEALEGESST